MQADDGPPNFFCRLPTTNEKAKKADRSASPPPLAFLQHIFDNYRQIQESEEISDHKKSSRSKEESTADDENTFDLKGSFKNLKAQKSNQSLMGSVEAASSESSYQPEDGAAIEDDDDDAPWFSKLANLPQVRSAGIPLIAPPSTTNGRSSSTKIINSRPKPKATNESGPFSSSQHPSSSLSFRSVEPSSSYSSMIMSPSSIASSDAALEAMSSSVASLSTTDGSNSMKRYHSNDNTNKQKCSTLPTPPPLLKHQLTSTTSTSTTPLVPPDNFAMVNSWVYRSSFPKKRHFPFLKTLGLKSVLTLILEEYPEQNTRFLDDNGITFFQFGIPGNKEPFVQIPQDKITAALVTILDRRNHPILIHCNKGKHRTGCLIGCLRKLQQWSLTTIFDEYRRFSFPKSRSMDQEFIELYSERVVWLQIERLWLPRWAVLAKGGRGHMDDDTTRDNDNTTSKDVSRSSTHSLPIDTIRRLKMRGM